MKNNKYIDMLLQHQQNLLQEFFDITEEIRYKESLNLDNNEHENPQEILEDNLVEIVYGSEAYAKIDHIREELKEKKLIEEHASNITNELKEKANQDREQYLKEKKRLKDASILQMMFGQSRDVLVLKFIEKLRTAVQNRKDITAQRASTEFIRKILNKKNFNDQFKVVK